MKQRKLIIVMLLVAVAAIVAGCNKNNNPSTLDPSLPEGYEPSTTPITFQGLENWGEMKSVSTRNELQGDFVNGSSIGVLAHYIAGGFIDNKITVTPNFMYNQKVIYDGSKWNYSPTKYWPNNTADNVVFFGYLPYTTPDDVQTNCVTLSSAAAIGSPILTYTPNSIGELNTDLCCAGPVVKGYSDRADNVKLDFEHKLSKITFAIKHNGQTKTNDGRNTGDVVKINYISIRNIKGGTYNMLTDEWSTPESAAIDFMRISTTSGGINNSEILYNDQNGETVDDRKFIDVSTENTAYLIPPQTIGTGGDMIISINLELQKSHVENATEEEITPKIYATVEIPTKSISVEMGRAYKFNIELDVKNFIAIRLAKVTEEDWYDEQIDLGEIE